MASADVVPEGPTAGNTSQDSGGSGSHKSMLELLSITDAAVKALNKSSHGSIASHASGKSLDSDRSVKSDHSVKSGQSVTSHRSQTSHQSLTSHHSQQSLRSQHSDRSRRDRIPQKFQQDVDEVSRDSGVGSKTQTLSDHLQKKGAVAPGVPPIDGSLHERSSDESTTASDVLIRSTLDKSERSILETNGSISKYSKSSFGVENFNSSGPHKIKISKKHLREIKPFDDGQNPRSSSDSDGKVPSSLLGKSKSSKSNSNSSGSSDSKSTGSKSGGSDSRSTGSKAGSQKDSRIHGVSNGTKLSVNVIRNTNGAPSFPKGVDNMLPAKETVTKVTDKAIPLGSLEMKPDMFPKQQVTGIAVERKADFAAIPQFDKHATDANLNAAGNKNGAPSKEPIDQLRSTPKYFIERHTPQKSQASKESAEERVLIPERKNLLQDLEDSVEITTVHGKDSSSSSSQPDILTVPERIVTVAAKTSLSESSSSISDLGLQTFTPPTVTVHTAEKQLARAHVTGNPTETSKADHEPVAGSSHMPDDHSKPIGTKEPGLADGEEKYFDYKSVERSFMGESISDESRHIPPALPRGHFEREPEDKDKGQGQTIPARFQRFSKASSHGLRQGAMVDGVDAPDKQKLSDDVEIVQTRQSEKQKAREIFAKRQGGPVRRVVQPQIVSHKTKPSSQTGEFQEPQLGQSNNQVLTTAAAASAAVAATQPFLKAQYEMEAKMAEVLAKISELQSGGVKAPATETDRVQVLEKQLAESTEKRIEYMERLQEQQMAMQVKLQEQQMAMQAKLLSLTRGTAVSRLHGGSRSPDNVYRRPETSTPSAAHLNKAFTKTVINKPAPKANYSDRLHKYADVDDSNSPLDTPAPRSRAPKPTSYDTSDIEFKARQKAKSRSRSRSPAKKDQDAGILHQILASTGSPLREKVQPPPLQIRA